MGIVPFGIPAAVQDVLQRQHVPSFQPSVPSEQCGRIGNAAFDPHYHQRRDGTHC